MEFAGTAFALTTLTDEAKRVARLEVLYPAPGLPAGKPCRPLLLGAAPGWTAQRAHK